jgi:hypothetical protein
MRTCPVGRGAWRGFVALNGCLHFKRCLAQLDFGRTSLPPPRPDLYCARQPAHASPNPSNGVLRLSAQRLSP